MIGHFYWTRRWKFTGAYTMFLRVLIKRIIAMMLYSTFLKPQRLEPHNRCSLVSQETCWETVLSLCKGYVSVFYSPCRQSWIIGIIIIFTSKYLYPGIFSLESNYFYRKLIVKEVLTYVSYYLYLCVCELCWLIHSIILTACQPLRTYFMPGGLRWTFFVS